MLMFDRCTYYLSVVFSYWYATASNPHWSANPRQATKPRVTGLRQYKDANVAFINF